MTYPLPKSKIRRMPTIETVQNPSVEILARKPFSSHPGDSYLDIVLCRRDHPYHKYVVWSRNLAFGANSLNTGDYFESLMEAIEAYDQRGKIKTELAKLTKDIAERDQITYE